MSADARREADRAGDALVFGGAPLGERQRSDLEAFREQLSIANRRTNLVGRSTLEDFWRRHVIDCGQLLDLAPEARIWADLGAGAGFPGLVLAILLKGRSGADVRLVESRGKRCEFLRETLRRLDLPGEVIQARAETLCCRVEVVTARALAPLDRLLGLARGFLAGDARALFLKGEGVEAELAAARRKWRFDCRIHPSRSDPRGRIVELAEARRA